MRSAVATAVPDGESALPAWCASTISIDSNHTAACSAKRPASTAPTEKFGHDEHRGGVGGRAPPGVSAMRSPDQPLVPTSTGSPASVAAATTRRRHLRQGDVDHRVDLRGERERVGRADALHDLRVRQALHHLGDEAAHAATGSDDGEADHGRPP